MIDVARIVAEAVARHAAVSKPPRPQKAQEQIVHIRSGYSRKVMV